MCRSQTWNELSGVEFFAKELHGQLPSSQVKHTREKLPTFNVDGCARSSGAHSPFGPEDIASNMRGGSVFKIRPPALVFARVTRQPGQCSMTTIHLAYVLAKLAAPEGS